jgi:TonB family protein
MQLQLMARDRSDLLRAGIRRAFSSAGVAPVKGGVVSKLSSWSRVVVAAALTVMVMGTTVIAQQTVSDDSKRKVKSHVAPVYPELARRMNVSGRVKIEVIIAPDGHVRSARAIGGHPLLVQSCQDALKDWKFVASPDESTQILEFEFKN